MPEVVLDELERAPRVQEVRRDRVAQPVTGEGSPEIRPVPVLGEERLDLAFAEGSRPTGEERAGWAKVGAREVPTQQARDRREERSLGPDAALVSADHDSGAEKVHVRPLQQRYLADAVAVQVYEREERPSRRSQIAAKKRRGSSWVR